MMEKQFYVYILANKRNGTLYSCDWPKTMDSRFRGNDAQGYQPIKKLTVKPSRTGRLLERRELRVMAFNALRTDAMAKAGL
jgi:hypothetical protein